MTAEKIPIKKSTLYKKLFLCDLRACGSILFFFNSTFNTQNSTLIKLSSLSHPRSAALFSFPSSS
jgi:hypothetical protein